ncbi:hypothetical protein WL19_30130 [Burkholderia ubonensis]|nr:hypothetical protein WL19_30130 [Burkholderia ubonensis]
MGGRYSDELLKKEEAELLLHTLTREEADKEQLRYRIWQLEQTLRDAYSHVTLLATGQTTPMSNAEMVDTLGKLL